MDLSNENVLHIKKDGIEYLQFKRLLEFDNLINCYTLRPLNYNKKTLTNQELKENYNNICKALEIERKNLIRPHQSHTDCIKNVERTDVKYTEVDGFITNKPNIDLTLSFADCTPILLYDPVKKVIANIHSGWRGTVQKIGKKAVEKMIKDYQSNPQDIIACIGPCIGKCHFEVKEDVKDIFEQTFSYLGRNDDIIEKESLEKYKIDTTLINRLLLENSGLLPENIIESKICTVCNSQIMHSYRVDKEKSGRNITILGMKGE